MSFIRAFLIVAVLGGSLPTAFAQQYFTGSTGEECAARGGQIITWTNTPTPSRPYAIGECYVPPRVTSAPSASFGGGAGGAGRAAAALGAAAAFLGLFSAIVEETQRFEPSTPAPAYDYLNSPEYKEMQERLRAANAEADKRTSDLQDFIRRSGGNRRGAVSGGLPEQCRGYPATPEGLSVCQTDVAFALEEKARACADDGCRAAFLKAAATARCTAGFQPSPAHVRTAAQHCTRYPGDYERLQKMILETYPWAYDADRAPLIIRDKHAISIQKRHQQRTGYNPHLERGEVEVEIQVFDDGRLIRKTRSVIDERCLGTRFDATICDLMVKAKDARDRGWAPTTPFNCDRARGRWEGDIVNGRCRLPGDKSKPYDPGVHLKTDAAALQWQVDEAIRYWQEGKAANALLYAKMAEQTFATMLGLTTTMSPETRARTIDAGLAEIRRLSAALN